MRVLGDGVERFIQRKYSALISKPMQGGASFNMSAVKAQIDKAIGERAVGKWAISDIARLPRHQDTARPGVTPAGV
jgi:hypothetical protein